MKNPEWSVPFEDDVAVRKLHDALLSAWMSTRRSGPDVLYDLVDVFSGLRVHIFAREHSPPHFRVSSREESANYRISDCMQLNGGLRRYYRFVRAWHAEHKTQLIDTWNRTRPSDCPVGEYRDA
jgi:hypothetical protein